MLTLSTSGPYELPATFATIATTNSANGVITKLSPR